MFSRETLVDIKIAKVGERKKVIMASVKLNLIVSTVLTGTVCLSHLTVLTRGREQFSIEDGTSKHLGKCLVYANVIHCTPMIIWVSGVLRMTVVDFCFRGNVWSPTTVPLRTPVTQLIIFNPGMLLLGSNHFLIYVGSVCEYGC